MPAYLVFTREHVRDRSALDHYAANVRKTFDGHAVEVLVAYGAIERLEGATPEGAVILRFADRAAAAAWYRSPAYQEVVAHRHRGADYRAFVVEGT